MANIFVLPKDGNITPEKARKSRQMQFRDKNVIIARFRQIYLNFYQRMGILPLKKRVNRDKCSFTTKQRMFGVFAIDEILRYRWTPFEGSRTLCRPGCIYDWDKWKQTWCWGILGSQVVMRRKPTLGFWDSAKANSFRWGWPSWTEVRYNKVLFESNSPQCQSGSILLPIQWNADNSGILILKGIGLSKTA